LPEPRQRYRPEKICPQVADGQLPPNARRFNVARLQNNRSLTKPVVAVRFGAPWVQGKHNGCRFVLVSTIVASLVDILLGNACVFN
jgi:hypothetical protein